jgi:hypothetical protein
VPTRPALAEAAVIRAGGDPNLQPEPVAAVPPVPPAAPLTSCSAGSEQAESYLEEWAAASSSTLSAHSDPAPPPLSATVEDVPRVCKRKPTGWYVVAAHRGQQPHLAASVRRRLVHGLHA